MSKKKSAGYNPAQQKGNGSSKDQATLNAKAKEGREKAAARKKQAAGKGTPKSHTMGRTPQPRLKFMEGNAYDVIRPLVIGEGLVVEPGYPVLVKGFVGSKGIRIVANRHEYLIPVGKLFKACAA